MKPRKKQDRDFAKLAIPITFCLFLLAKVSHLTTSYGNQENRLPFLSSSQRSSDGLSVGLSGGVGMGATSNPTTQHTLFTTSPPPTTLQQPTSSSLPFPLFPSRSLVSGGDSKCQDSYVNTTCSLLVHVDDECRCTFAKTCEDGNGKLVKTSPYE